MRKFIVTVVFFLGIFGCGTCPEFLGYYFDINGVVIFNMERRSTNVWAGIKEGTKLKFSDHSFAVSYAVSYYSLNDGNNFNLLSSAFATSCIADGEGGSHELLDTMVITTNYDIDDDHLKGQTINDLILYDGVPLIEFLSKDSIEIPNQAFSLDLIKRPELDNSLSINVYVKLTNGEEYSATSERVFIE